MRELLGACLLRGYSGGLYVSTAEHFSRSAVKVAETAVRRGLVEKFERIDRRRFFEMLPSVSSKVTCPWDTPLVLVVPAAPVAPEEP